MRSARVGVTVILVWLATPANATVARTAEYELPSADFRGTKSGEEIVAAPAQPSGGVVLTSFRTYSTYRDDDFSVEIEEQASGQMRFAWSRGDGAVAIDIHRVALPAGARILERTILTSDALREEGLPARRTWQMARGERCILLTELRQTSGSDDDASYRLTTNNRAGGNDTCTLDIDFGHGKRDFKFVVSVLVWDPSTVDLPVTITRLRTTKESEVVSVEDLPRGAFRLITPVVDWGSDDDVSFGITAIPQRDGDLVSLRRSFGFREIEFEILDVGRSVPPEPGECEDLDGDGFGRYGSAACAQSTADCNDADPEVHPGGSEVAGDGVDNDCSKRTDDNGCTWGSRDCNRCVEDVEGQFAGFGLPNAPPAPYWLEQGFESLAVDRVPPNGRFTFHSGAGWTIPGLDNPFDPIDDDHGHVQGFARVPGLGEEDWFVFSRSNKGGRAAGLVFMRLNGEDTIEPIPGRNGERLVAPPDERDTFWEETPSSDDPDDDRGPNTHVHIPETNHPGGLQVLGHLVAVPSYCNHSSCNNRAFVDFYDAAVCAVDPLTDDCLVNRKALPDRWYISSNKAYYVAVTRVPDGRYVMVVNRSDYGPAQSFISSTTTIDASTEWLHRTRQTWTRNFENGSNTYQNMNFVTECTTRSIYLLGFAQDRGFGTNTNFIDLFRVKIENESDVDIRRLRRAWYLDEFEDSCEMDGGAGVYVTPHGEMIVYCSQGRTREGNPEDDPRFLDFAEHTSATNGAGLKSDSLDDGTSPIR